MISKNYNWDVFYFLLEMLQRHFTKRHLRSADSERIFHFWMNSSFKTRISSPRPVGEKKPKQRL